MGKASRTKQSTTRQERIAAQRAAAKRAEQRRRLLTAGGSVIAVLAVVLGFVIFKVTQHPASHNEGVGGPTGSSLTSVISQVTSVPSSTLDAAGVSGVQSKPQSVQGSAAPLTQNGKPELLYMGAEYCPYCAAERWSMIVALSRFGTFSGLQTMRSSSTDVFANTPTWTFVNATYTSSYLTFTSVEMQDRNRHNLQTPTSAENALIGKYDAPPYVTSSNTGAIPFLDFGNKYLIIGSSYMPSTIDGLTWAQVASDLSNPSSPVAKAIDGTANYMTAALCKLTGNTPSNVCTSSIQSLQGQI